MKREHNNSNTNKILNIMIVFVMTFVVILGFLWYKQASNTNEKEMTKVISVVDDKKIKEDKDILKEYQEYYQNKDIIGRLSIEGTRIDTLLVQTTNNSFYLNHNLNREYERKGATFVDYRTPFNSKQINIYGHSSPNRTFMFSDLINYTDKDFYENHKYIKLWDGKVNKVYEIASVYIDKTEHEHMITNPLNKRDHIDKLSQSLYKTKIDLKEDDDLLILQTCYYKPKNSFLVVVAKYVK